LRKIYFILFPLGLLFSCSTSKQTSSKNDEYNPEVTALFLDASKQKLIGNYDKAIDFCQQALELDKDNHAVLYELSQLYMLTGSYGYSIDNAEKAVKLNPKNEWYNLHLAHLYRANGLYKEAANVYEGLVKNHPKKMDYAMLLAEIYIYSGQQQKAIDALTKIEQSMGVNEEISLQKRDLHLQLGEKSKAVAVMQELIKNYPSEYRYYGYLAETYETIGDSQKAFETYQKVLQLDPENGIVHFYLFQYYIKANKEQEAINHLSYVYKSSDITIDLKIQILLTLIERNTEKFNTLSYELLDILSAQHPTEAKTYSIYGDFLRRDKRIIEAIDKYRLAVELDNTRFAIWNELMILETEANKFDWMEEDSQKAMEIFPAQPGFYLFNGLANLQLKNYKKSVESLNSGKALVIDNKPALLQFYHYLGDAYHKLGEHEKSDKNYDLALEIDPLNPTVLNNYAYYLSLRGEQLDKAEKMIKKANELYPNQISFLDTYGWVMYKKGDYEKAKELIKKAIELGAKSGEVYEHLGDAYFKLGMINEAMEYWNKALSEKDHSELLPKKISDKKLYE
jgi:tetratricopeptide (TPR) repeat protein